MQLLFSICQKPGPNKLQSMVWCFRTGPDSTWHLTPFNSPLSTTLEASKTRMDVLYVITSLADTPAQLWAWRCFFFGWPQHWCDVIPTLWYVWQEASSRHLHWTSLKSAKAKIQFFLAAAIAVLYLSNQKQVFLTSKSDQQGTNINIGGHKKAKQKSKTRKN